ncbi:hypothetical protein RRG08_011610 [Elysia crispata]|uniref:Uncharacterized protein n=1 Tax=Elysia crispata TaxID=231223 RepID=A0AAE0XP56_9GAST|nr:hypothetical protein RRG08_011610 [Elysia crispata]
MTTLCVAGTLVSPTDDHPVCGRHASQNCSSAPGVGLSPDESYMPNIRATVQTYVALRTQPGRVVHA